MNKAQYREMEKKKCKHGVTECSYKSLLSSINDIDLIELMDLISILDQCSDATALMKVFVGSSAPNVDNLFKTNYHQGL